MNQCAGGELEADGVGDALAGLWVNLWLGVVRRSPAQEGLQVGEQFFGRLFGDEVTTG